ncbi:nucleotidyltransferase domain-containing protein [Nanoarchaeota archaeon]|nr:MAG: nucleotidyltransferase domain-containing protein [Nanoarchaeota archaeon]
MSDELLVEEALRRRKVFARLGELLQRIKKRVLELDPEAEVYLFGSVAEGRSTYSSDIDVLVVTDRRVEEVLPRLWEIGVEDPLEIHVRPRSMLEQYRRRSKLIKI